MYKVTGKKSGIIWDADNNKPLVRFTDGIFETEEKEIAVKLQSLGYAVEGLAEAEGGDAGKGKGKA